MQQARDVILAYLARAGRARRTRLVLHRTATVLSVLAAALTAVLLLLLVLPGARPWLALALLSIGISGLGLVAGARLSRIAPEPVARWITRCSPRLGGAVADALEFAGHLQRGEPIPTGSAALATAHVHHVARGLRGQDPGRHARRALPRLGGRRAAVAVGVALLAFAFLSRSRDLLLTGLAPGGLDAARYGSVELRYSYPEYLGLAQQTQHGPGDVQAPVGTHVRVRIEADRPLEWARLELASGTAQDMSVDGAAAEGRLVVVRDGSYRIQLQGRIGDVDREPPEHAIRAVEDAPPVVRLRSPVEDVVLDEGEELELLYRVADDHGVADVVLVVEPESARAEESAQLLQAFDPPTPASIGTRKLVPRRLGIEAGTSAWISVSASDADAVTGPKLASSRRVRVSVRSAAELREHVDEKQAELAERILVLLAEHLVNHPDELPDREALARALEGFDGKLEEVLNLFPSVLADLHEGPEADFVAGSALEDMHLRLRSVGRSRARDRPGLLLRSGQVERLRSLLASTHPGEVEELERDVLFFDMWADRRAALRASDAAAELLAAAQRQLATIEAAASEPPEASEAEVATALVNFAPRLAALEELGQELARAVPDELGASALREGLAAVGELQAEVVEAVGRGTCDAAAPPARELVAEADMLAAIVEQLAAQGAVADREIMRELQDVHAELSRQRARQADLRDRTNAIRRDARQAMTDEAMAHVEELYEELLELTDQALALHRAGEEAVAEAPALQRFFESLEERASLEQRLIEIDRLARRALRPLTRAEEVEYERLLRRLGALHGESLDARLDVAALMGTADASRELLGRLRQTLVDRDLAAARRPARRALGELELLALVIDSGGSADVADRAAPFRGAQARTAEVLGRLDELEEQLQAAAQGALDEAQLSSLEELAADQAGLAEQAGALAERLRELGVDAPFLSEQVGGAVGRACEQMWIAESELDGKEPAPASESQGEALANLEEASRLLSPEGARGRGQGGDGVRWPPARHLRDEVDIPDPEDYRVPKEFREEILAAMRESSPPRGYEQQVREYYRRLVE